MPQVDAKLLAPCGLYCGVCAVRIAHRDNNQKLKEKLAGFYGVSPEALDCDGCMSEVRSDFCRVCQIRDCTTQKGYQGCHECDDWPCSFIEEFPVPVGKKVIMRAIPYWKTYGTEKYAADETARYLCPDCGQELFRGAKRCRQCQNEVDLD